MRYLPLLLALCLPFSALGGVYKWVDENGKIHFGDRPRVNAEEVKLRNTAPPTEATPVTPPADPAAAEEKGYKRLAIISPRPDASLAGRDLVVEFALEPALKKGDTFTLLLNGNPMIKGLTASPAQLSGIRRAGSVEVVVQGSDGATVIRSGAIPFQP